MNTTTEGPGDVALVQLIALPSVMANAIQTLSTARALAEIGCRAHVFVRSGGLPDPIEHLERAHGVTREAGVRIHRLRGRHKGVSGLLYRATLARLMRGSRRIAFYARNRRHALSLLRMRGPLGGRRRIVYEFHNLEHVLAREAGNVPSAERIRDEEERIVREADGIVAISRPLADDVASAFGLAAPPEVIEDGVDLARFRSVGRPNPSPARTRILYAGSLFPHKGVESLLRALALLPERVTLDVVGGHPASELERLRTLAEQWLGLAGRVHFAGHLPPADVPSRFAEADLVAIPAGGESRSTRYTSPLKLFEAMATGVPIVAVATPALASVLADGRDAFLAPDASPASLADAISRALASPERARALGRAAMSESESYGWTERARRIVSFLEGVALRHGGR